MGARCVWQARSGRQTNHHLNLYLQSGRDQPGDTNASQVWLRTHEEFIQMGHDLCLGFRPQVGHVNAHHHDVMWQSADGLESRPAVLSDKLCLLGESVGLGFAVSPPSDLF